MLLPYEIPKGVREGEIRCRIRQLRLRLLVHSYLYYATETQIVKDSQWDMWAMELVKLQKKYPYIAKFVCYAKAFEGFDGSTGFNLPWNDDNIRGVGDSLVKTQNQISKRKQPCISRRKDKQPNRKLRKIKRRSNTR